MGTLAPTLSEIIKALNKRVTALESAPNIRNESITPTLTIVNLATIVTQYIEDTTGQMRGRVLLNWDDIAAPNTDSLAVDPFDHFDVYYTLPTETNPIISRTDQSAVIFNNLPLDVNVTFGVRAVTAAGVKGTYATITINTSHDAAPPNQPSTPIVTAALKSVIVTWDGKDVAAAAMSADLAYCEVHVSKTSATFTPTTATYINRLYKGGGVINVFSDDTYATLYIRLVAYDTSGNASIASTAGSATPLRAIETDLAIALPGDIAYRDEGNLIVDGSFESNMIRAIRTASAPKIGTWTFDNTSGFPAFGDYCLKVVGDSSPEKYIYLNGYSYIVEAPIVANTKLYVSVRVRGISGTGTASVVVRFRSQSDILTTVTAVTTSTSTGSYVLLEGVVTVPANGKSCAVYLHTQSHTTGTWYFDAIQLRTVIGTMLIEDAAITTAKIASLAVNDAKIADLSAAKITTGQLQATTEIIAGSTSTSHARLTGTGLHIFGPDTTGDGIPDEVIRLGTTSSDYFGIVSGSGEMLASIDQNGNASFQGLNVQQDPIIQGQPLSSRLDALPKGIIVTKSNATQTWQSCTTEVGLGELNANVLPGRVYRLTMMGARVYTDQANTAIEYIIKYTVGGGVVSIATPDVLRNVIVSATSAPYYCTVPPISRVFGGNGFMRFLLTAHRLAGTGLCTTYWDANSPLQFTLEDLGTVLDTPWVPNNGGGTGVPNTVQYQSTWRATASASYNGNGTLRGAHPVYQGQYDGTRGNQYGHWDFSGNAIAGETDKTMAAALSTAVSIDQVEFYLYSEHWWWNSGGTAQVYVHNGGGASRVLATTLTLPKPGGSWKDITSFNAANWKTSYRGIAVGPGPTTALDHYGYFTGVGGTLAQLPQVRIKYTR